MKNREANFMTIADGNFNSITAIEWVAGIRAGWCLGNTLDAHASSYESYNNLEGFSWLGGGIYANTTSGELETAWGNELTTKNHIDAVYNAGFNAIRIPVTWFKVTDAELNIRADWMARVVEIVGFAVNNDMYIILDTHHDECLFRLLDKDMEESKKNLVKIWEQIACTFRDYNEKLIFECLNEPRTYETPAQWDGGTAEERHNLNILNQLFVDTVRSTAGNNTQRILVVTTYAALPVEVAQRALVVPIDSIQDRIIVSLHIYEPGEFAICKGTIDTTDAWNKDNPKDTRSITEPMDLAYELFLSKGIPVIIGEMGAINRNNIDARVAWAEYFTYQAYVRSIPCFWWDSGSFEVSKQHDWGWDETFGLLDRKSNQFAHPEIVDALMSTEHKSKANKNTMKIPQLRILATTFCGCQCLYCRPSGEGHISYTEDRIIDMNCALKVCKLYKNNGGKSVKITGGDPVFWPHLVEFVGRLKSEVGINRVEIITRSPKIVSIIDSLVAAGLDLLDFSFDSIDKKTYKKITGCNNYDSFISIIRICSKKIPIKINTVVMKGINDSNIKALIEFCESISARQLKLLDVINDFHESSFSNESRLKTVGANSLRDIHISLAPICEEISNIAVSKDIVFQGGLGHPMNEYTLPSGLLVTVKNSENGAWYGEFCKKCSYYPCHDALMALRLTADNHLQYCLLNDNISYSITGLSDEEMENEFAKSLKIYKNAYFKTK
jgi:molybdenum cofactor biosynthesis enzyme MoaA